MKIENEIQSCSPGDSVQNAPILRSWGPSFDNFVNVQMFAVVPSLAMSACWIGLWIVLAFYLASYYLTLEEEDRACHPLQPEVGGGGGGGDKG